MTSALPERAPGRVEDRSVTDVPAWRDLVGRLFVPLDVTAGHGPFRAHLRSVSAGGVDVCVLDAESPHAVAHGSPHRPGASAAGVHKVSLQLAGHSLVVQDGREALLGPGDLAVYDTGRPYALEGGAGFSTLVLKVTGAQLGVPPAGLAQLTAVRLAADGPTGRLVSPLLRELAAHPEHLASAAGPRVLRSAVDLLGAGLLAQLGADPAATRSAAVRRWIEDHLHEPLTPAAIAAAHHLSVRSLHALFHADGDTVAAWVRRRRLENCRRDLTDPARAGTTVAAVGRHWGFADAAHFSRVYRAEFGLSPREQRGDGPVLLSPRGA